MKKLITLRKLYNYDEKTVTTEEVTGYEFTAEMTDGAPITLHVRKSASGKTWEVVDPQTLMLLGSMFGSRKNATERVSELCRTKLTAELYASQAEKQAKLVADFKEVQ